MAGLNGMLHPANSTLTIAKATRSRVEASWLSFSHMDKNGHSTPVLMGRLTIAVPSVRTSMQAYPAAAGGQNRASRNDLRKPGPCHS